ncbi:glycosyl transferase [Bacteroidia bacterium]|nr:glycosyl transferase [Bacteroidia bacterium]
MISIVIPLYNKEKHIARTLQTVFNQTFQDFEIVIVDDGSTDHSISEVEKFNDSRIRLIQQPNAGVSAARNRGIEEAKYNLIAFLDADDEWKSEYLQTQSELVQKYPECKVFACNYEFKNENGKITPTIINKLSFKEIGGVLDNYFEVAACSHPPLWTSAVVAKKEAILSIGGFPTGVKQGEDLLTWARLAVRYKIAYSKNTLAIFNINNDDSKPKRNPVKPDVVGAELKHLGDSNSVKGLRQYNSLWHKMRASMYLRLNDRKNAFRETGIALRLNPLNYKLLIYIVLLILPLNIGRKLLR